MNDKMKYLVIHQNTTLGDTNISVIEAEDEAEICDKFLYPEYVTAVPLKGVLTAIGYSARMPDTRVEEIKRIAESWLKPDGSEYVDTGEMLNDFSKVTRICETMLSSAPRETEDFPITSVSREDIKHASFPDVEFTDAEMTKIAQKLCNDYIEQMYWKSLEIIAGQVLDERTTGVEEQTCDNCRYLSCVNRGKYTRCSAWAMRAQSDLGG